MNTKTNSLEESRLEQYINALVQRPAQQIFSYI